MNTITAIEVQKGRKGRVNVFLDGSFAFSFSLPLAAEVGLRPGQTLSHTELEQLKGTDQVHCALEKALKYLSPRPRSEAEIKSRLRRNGFDGDTIQQVLTRLKEQGLVNDAAFAQFWLENRENFRPRSRQLLGLELKQKGIETETIAQTIAEVDDEHSAYHAAQRKARTLTGLDRHSFRKRLGTFLRRRGFSFELINHTIDQVWQEHVKSQPDL